MLIRNTSRFANEQAAFAEFFFAKNITGRGGRISQKINRKAKAPIAEPDHEIVTRITEDSTGTILFGAIDLVLLEQLYGHTTGGYLALIKAPDVVEVKEQNVSRHEVNVTSIPEKLAAIRSELSLNISELASVLRVERPTIYAWIDGTMPHEQNRVRLESLFTVALSWRQHSNLPLGDIVREKVFNGHSISTLLGQLEIPIPEIEKIFISVKARINGRLPNEDGHRQLSVREMRARHGISKSGRSGSREEVEVLSGKRARPE